MFTKLVRSGTRWKVKTNGRHTGQTKISKFGRMAISVGSNPTFDGVSRQVEAHVIDRPEESVEDFDLYGQTVIVEFVQRLRGMVAYRGPEALVDQMRLDVVQAHNLLARR